MLSYSDMVQLDEFIKRRWAHFIEWMPVEWDTEGFFCNSILMLLIKRYGQNRQTCRLDKMNEDRRDWEEMVPWNSVKRFSFALATEIK